MRNWVHCPPELAEGSPADNLTVEIHGDQVSLKFFRATTTDEYPAPGETLDRHTVGVVVAHVIISRQRWDNLPAVIAAIREGLDGAEGPGLTSD